MKCVTTVQVFTFNIVGFTEICICVAVDVGKFYIITAVDIFGQLFEFGEQAATQFTTKT